MSGDVFTFGSFRFLTSERILLNDGKPLRLGSRALDILLALVERAGDPVAKQDLMARVWPTTFVDEASLRVHISALRKALGERGSDNRFIVNVAGRGYVFVARTVREQAGSSASASASASASPPPPAPARATAGNDIPASLSRIIGRDAVIVALTRQLAQRRLITIVGPGGIGKTTVAAAVANAARDSYPDGVWFVGLASLSDPGLLPGAVGSVLGIPLSGADPIGALTARLSGRRALIVLDNCEHVIEAVADLVEAVLRSAPSIGILATSREPLRADGEWRHRLAPLEFPRDTELTSAAEALDYPAVQLFHERAHASNDRFAIADQEVSAVAAICRRLEGVPLALELAAGHVATFGVREVLTRLDNRLVLLMRGRRTVLARQQTLRATLDWSYGLLPEVERAILRRLAVFQGGFTIDAAIAVAGDADLTGAAIVHGVANLVDKSLITADIGEDVTRYHLLELTRAYASECQRESGEQPSIARRHATLYRDALADAALDGRAIGDVRAALDWAFSPDGDAELAVSLAAVATDFWIRLSMLGECCDWGLKGVARLGALEGTRHEMMLRCGLGQSLTFSQGMRAEIRSELQRALTLAETLDDTPYQFRAICALWLFALRVVDYPACLTLAHACRRLGECSGDALVTAVADFLLGQTQYYFGEHADAAASLRRAWASYPMAMRAGDPVRFGVDVRTCVLCYQAVTSWTLGFSEQALRAGRDAIEEARSVQHPVTLCNALGAPSSILLVKMGHLAAAADRIDELMDVTEKNALTPYHAFALCAKGGLAAARGDLREAEGLLRLGLTRSRDVGYLIFDAFFQAELAAVLGASGRIAEALAEVDAALRYAEESKSLWCTPEVLRIKGALLARSAGPERDAAETWFLWSRDLARRQGALAWELRAVMDLARFWHERHRTTEARELLGEVYARFTEGFDAADLLAARALLADLAGE
ncbi:MAG: winged helix-turn-helix domain-containing protein [Acetobacteraceae bacterium]